MFVELTAKSNFSFLRGASDSRELILQACSLGMKAIGITDINGVYALPRAYELIKDSKLPIKLICGAEITLWRGHPPITLIAQTRKSYGLMCRIITQVHAGKEKGEGFITFSELSHLLENHEGRNRLTCIVKAESEPNLELLKSLFPNEVYLSLCRYLDGLDGGRTKKAKELSQNFELPIVATNDVHYHLPDRRPLQDCLACIREDITMQKASLKLFGNDERYLKSELQMRALFADIPEAVRNTGIIADKCTFCLSELKYTYPKEFIPKGHTSQSFLVEVSYAGAQETYRGVVPHAVDVQIRHELKLIEKLNYADYFLTIYDIVRFAKSKNIICQGRGSAANSIICYVLGITSVDPVNMKLLFERFISEERSEPPDIDVDFEHERREEVIQYIYERYGRERAGMVAAIRTYQARSSLLELSKAIGIEVGTMSAKELLDNFDEYAKDLKIKRPYIEKLVREIAEFPRHLSIHSGGFTLSHEPLVEIVPIEPARMEGRTIVQWDKNDLETLGLMKVDVLSLGFLTAMHKAADLAGISWRDIPPNDPATYKLIRSGETEGTFQIESRAQKAMLVRTLPEEFYDLVVQVAIVRPGPSVGQMIHPYIQGRTNARNAIPYRMGDPEIEAILGRTYGVPVFQEQLMKIAIVKAGFTPGEADQLRRAVAGWRNADGITGVARKLYEGLLKNGVNKDFANKFFTYLKGYAHYGFPESHAASFASIAYKSAYLKTHFPAELLCGLINSQPMGFYHIDTLINEAKRKGVRVLPLNPNLSHWDAVLEAPKTVRMGFRNLKKIREENVNQLLVERSIKPFKSVEDFIYRTRFSKDVIENMAIGNVFECFGLDRRHTFWQSLEFGALVGALCEKRDREQLSLFTDEAASEKPLPLFSAMSLLEETTADYRKMGYSLNGNYMRALRLEFPWLPPLTSVQLKKLPAKEFVRYAGTLIVNQRPPSAKTTGFITLEDEFGTVDLILRGEIYDRYKPVFQNSRFLIIEGHIQRQGRGVNVLVNNVESFAENRSRKPETNLQSPRGLTSLEWMGDT
jgi:error-prone DNA polymerase